MKAVCPHHVAYLALRPVILATPSRIKSKGTVILEAVVDADGAISNIRVMKPMPYGLTAAALQAVRSWRLAPATAQDGKPIKIREVFEVSFHRFYASPPVSRA
jgi:TonB family protein